MKPLRSIGVLTSLAAGILISGCATIFGGRTNTLVFNPAGDIQAEVFLDDERIGEAPGKITVERNVIQHGSTLEIRAEGYQPMSFLILRKPHAGYVVADFVVGAIPLIVDAADGNLYRPVPRVFELEELKQE